MAVNIGPKIGIDGEAQFRKELNNIIQQSKTLESEMKAVTSSFDKNADSQEKLEAQTKILNQQIEVQDKRVELLEKGLRDAAKEYGDTATETLKWEQALNEAKTTANNMRSQLSKLENGVEDVAEELEDAGEAAFDFGDAFFANLLAGSIIEGVKSLAGEIGNLTEETKEYRKIMASLEVSSKNAGYSAQETAQSYELLYGVLADDQTAATTTANLQALGLSQDKLTQLTYGAIGAWATYGDSIPIDGLAEAINETIRTSAVTGTFADVLNWAGTSEDEFNKKLESANNETERANLVLQELSDQGLISAGKGWEENNKSLVESNRITAQFQENMATVGEKLEPAVNSVREGINRVLEKLLELTSNVDFSSVADSIENGFDYFINTVIPKVLEFGDFLLTNKDTIIAVITGIGIGFATWKVASIIEGVVAAIKGFSATTKTAAAVQAAFNSVMNANPIILITTLIAGLIAAIVTLWNTNEDFRNAVINAWNAIKAVFDSVWNAIAVFFTETLPNAWNAVVKWVSGIPEWWNNIWLQVGQFFTNIWNSIISFFAETIPAWIQSVIEWFNSLPEKIGYAIGQILGHIIQFGIDAWNWVTTELPQIIMSVIEWFASLPGEIWDFLVEIVTEIEQWGQQMWQAATTWVSDTVSAVIDWFANLPGRIWEWLKNVVSDIGRWGSELYQKAKSAVVNVVNSIIGWFKDLPSNIYNIGKDIITGLWDGINSMISWVWDKITGFFGGIVNGIKDVLGIHSPSKVFAELGKYSGEGFSQGLSDSMSDAFKTAKHTLKSGINSFDPSVPIPFYGSPQSFPNSTPIDYGGFVFNIYPAQGQDENSIADAVMYKIQNAVQRKGAVFK